MIMTMEKANFSGLLKEFDPQVNNLKTNKIF